MARKEKQMYFTLIFSLLWFLESWKLRYMDICFQGFRVCLTYDLKSRALFMYLFFVTVLSPRDQRLKHTILWSTDSERVGGSWAVSRNSKGLDMYIQREISEATWAGPAMPLKVSLQRREYMLSTSRLSSWELGRQGSRAHFSIPQVIPIHMQMRAPLSTKQPNRTWILWI